MQNLFQDLSKKELSTKKIHEIIIKAFFKALFKPNTYTKNIIFMPQQLLNRNYIY